MNAIDVEHHLAHTGEEKADEELNRNVCDHGDGNISNISSGTYLLIRR
jgi:hypothetical protein